MSTGEKYMLAGFAMIAAGGVWLWGAWALIGAGAFLFSVGAHDPSDGESDADPS